MGIQRIVMASLNKEETSIIGRNKELRDAASSMKEFTRS